MFEGKYVRLAREIEGAPKMEVGAVFWRESTYVDTHQPHGVWVDVWVDTQTGVRHTVPAEMRDHFEVVEIDNQ